MLDGRIITMLATAVFLYPIFRNFSKRRNKKSDHGQSSSSSHDPSPSSSSVSSQGPYDVFLSFRGQDTRKGFVSHLYTALVERGIHTFRDDERLERGRSVAPELIKAIDDSKIAIVIFSRNYANSSWCLEELVHIMEKENDSRIVIPVFYDVDPSDIRGQKNGVGDALSKAIHKHGAERLPEWEKALAKAGSNSGWDVVVNRNESECIKEIVTKVFRELNDTIPNDNKEFVGIETRMHKLLQKLRVEESNSVRMVGIWGMGGAGKSTTAAAIFRELSSTFGGSCFLKIAGDEHSEDELVRLQKTLLSEILKIKIDEIHITGSISNGTNLIRKRLQKKKVLIVLDNVGHQRQLDALAAEHRTWFGAGSRVIITTRDQQLLIEADDAYEVQLMSNNEALHLFSWHAFRRNKPHEDFSDLSHQVVECTKGLPLALRVLGSHLRGLNTQEWKSEIIKLQKIPNEEILSVLKISYDGLDKVNKDIFLDVACFFRGWKVADMKRILDSFDSYFQSGIRPLVRKSLLSVDELGIVEMHDLVQQMGKDIVRTSHPDSRLWKNTKISKVLAGNRDCEAVEGIVANRFSTSRGSIDLYPHNNISNEALRRMKRLRLLCLESGLRQTDTIGPEYLPDKLRWIHWNGYPGFSLPTCFEGGKLVGLLLRNSRIVELVTGQQWFEKLKIMDLSGSSEIRQTPDFSRIPVLEELDMNRCLKLEEVHSSFGVHKALQLVDFSYCENLRIFPEKLQMDSLERLDLNICMKLEKFPEIEGDNAMTDLEELNISYCTAKLPRSIRRLTGLRRLHLFHCDMRGWEIEDIGHSRLTTMEDECSNEFNNIDEETLSKSSSFIATRKAPSVSTSDDGQSTSSRIILFALPSSFHQLTYINLGYCDLSRFAIPPTCLPFLQELDLKANPIQELVISKECLSNSLRMLDLKFHYSRVRHLYGEMLQEHERSIPDLHFAFSKLLKQHHTRTFNLSNTGVSLINPALASKFDSGDQPIISQIDIMDWEALSRVLHRKTSELTIQMIACATSVEIPNWFKIQANSLPCEITLPSPSNWYNSKFKGLAIFISDNMSRTNGGVINFKYCCGKKSVVRYGFHTSEHILLFHYVPFGSQYLQCCLSNSETKDEFLHLLSAFFQCSRQTKHPGPDVKLGIRLVYEADDGEDQEAERYGNCDDIKVIPLPDEEPYVKLFRLKSVMS